SDARASRPQNRDAQNRATRFENRGVSPHSMYQVFAVVYREKAMASAAPQTKSAMPIMGSRYCLFSRFRHHNTMKPTNSKSEKKPVARASQIAVIEYFAWGSSM